MKHLYALLTNQCNLTCPHCNIKSVKDTYNEELFIKALTEFDGRVTIFGGEPTLYKDRLLKILSLNKADSISTNLIKLDHEFFPYFKKLGIGTSWNYSRFVGNQYQTWLDNLKRLEENDIHCRVMITVTPDLMASDITVFMDMIKLWDTKYMAVNSIMFEQLVDPEMTEEFYDQADEWLCEIHKLWEKYDIGIENAIIKKVHNWHCDCTKVYSLHPDGRITNGCPHMVDVRVATECLTCPQSDKCIPCRLQKYCTYPRKLAQLVKEE